MKLLEGERAEGEETKAAGQNPEPDAAVTAAALHGRVVVIVGGTTGLGFSAARACVEAGGRVVVVGRPPAAAAMAGAVDEISRVASEEGIDIHFARGGGMTVHIEFVKSETTRYRSRLHRADGVTIEFEGGSYNKIGGRPGAVPHDLAESQVFGHRRGAFRPSDRAGPGREDRGGVRARHRRRQGLSGGANGPELRRRFRLLAPWQQGISAQRDHNYGTSVRVHAGDTRRVGEARQPQITTVVYVVAARWRFKSESVTARCDA